MIFTGHLRKWLGYVYAELQTNRLKPEIVIKVKQRVALAVELSIYNLKLDILMSIKYGEPLPFKPQNV